MRKSVLIALVAAVSAGVLAMGWSMAAEKPPAAEKVKKARAFVLDDQDGNKVVMSTFHGQVVVLEWVNFDCPFSKRHLEAGTFRELYKKYKYGAPGAKPVETQPQQDRSRSRAKKQKVVWLAINSTHYSNAEQNKAAATKYTVPYPVLDDRLGRVGRLYGAKTAPHIFIKAPDGSLAYDGAIDDDPEGTKEEPLNYVAQALEEILTGKAVSIPKTKPYGTSITYPKSR
ncbi:MAG TPA: redoxin domain-containing protein [Phycisphaerae bacterium]|nr:redoxin domain-containing protein [Phycisphaerae bacterium]